MKQQGEDFICQVRYTDDDLQSLLPGGRLSFHLSDTIKELKSNRYTLTDELIACTNKAITNHLHLE
jgi:hypothetical protein